ncbi:MAG TPA: polyprenol monophosphomannose synthase, partial [bacterium]|nr:polyprenol monophosphomannose synthase [bacterium]
MTRALIVVPTYNEAENIPVLIQRIFALDFSEYQVAPEILVVDDSSPDGTADRVQTIQKNDTRVHLLSRPGKQGLGKAYVAGFSWALERGYEYILEMDADLSHDPSYLKDMFRLIRDNDLVIGSRYINGVNVINWPLKRLLISYFGNMYARMVTGMPIMDATAGYKCFRRSVLSSMDLTKVS